MRTIFTLRLSRELWITSWLILIFSICLSSCSLTQSNLNVVLTMLGSRSLIKNSVVLMEKESSHGPLSGTHKLSFENRNITGVDGVSKHGSRNSHCLLINHYINITL